MEWQAVIGLEVHVQLATRSKLFSPTATAFGAAANTQVNPYDLAMPGTLPTLNGEALRMAIRFGLAIGAEICRHSIFERKNYFYPDLPKGYQTSQLQFPIVGRGSIRIECADGSERCIGVTRAHMEEDAGKSLHEEFANESGIYLNRAGTPLLEIVSEPELRSAAEAVAYLKKLHSIVRYLGICDGDMSQGSMRCDANVSIRPRGEAKLGTRTEIKNVNSFRFVEKAIEYELRRQREVLEDGGTIVQETRLYDSVLDETRPMRGKEESNDYRYFPEPDLLPVVLDEAFLEQLRSELPELPDSRKERFEAEYGLSAYDAGVLTANRDMAEYFEQVAKACGDAKLAANWITVELLALLNREQLEIGNSPVSAAALARLISRISDGTISGKIAKAVFEQLAKDAKDGKGAGDVDEIIEGQGLRQVTDQGEIEQLVERVIAANAPQVEQYRGGRQQVLGYLVGQAMKLSQGKANPAQVNKLLREKLR